MKKYISASSGMQYDRITLKDGRYNYSLYETPLDTLSDINDYQAQISELHPYDLQEYVTAFIGYKGTMIVTYVQNSKVVGKETLELYDPEVDYFGLSQVKRENTATGVQPTLYEHEIDESENQQAYIDFCLDSVIRQVREYNKNIPSRIDHT